MPGVSRQIASDMRPGGRGVSSTSRFWPVIRRLPRVFHGPIISLQVGVRSAMLAVQANGKRRTRTRDSSITTAAPLLERSRDRIEIGEDERSQLAGSAFGELRDYYDVLVIERDTGHRVEEGLAVIVECYRPATPDAAILHIVRALGHLDDVADDPACPSTGPRSRPTGSTVTRNHPLPRLARRPPDTPPRTTRSLPLPVTRSVDNRTPTYRFGRGQRCGNDFAIYRRFPRSWECVALIDQADLGRKTRRRRRSPVTR